MLKKKEYSFLIIEFVFIALLILFATVFISKNARGTVIITDFPTDTITVGACEMNVFVARTSQEKISGMLGFTESTFNKDGMIFLGDTYATQYFHTMGMKMDIRMVGVEEVGDKTYHANSIAEFAPIGERSISIVGSSVLEIPEKLYNAKFKNCLYE